MCRVGFEFFGSDTVCRIKINDLRVFCAVGYIWESLKSKTNEIANVCGIDHSFEIVMFMEVPIDNMPAILLIC